MRMIIGVGTEDMEREMSRNGTHILASLFLQKMMSIYHAPSVSENAVKHENFILCKLPSFTF